MKKSKVAQILCMAMGMIAIGNGVEAAVATMYYGDGIARTGSSVNLDTSADTVGIWVRYPNTSLIYSGAVNLTSVNNTAATTYIMLVENDADFEAGSLNVNVSNINSKVSYGMVSRTGGSAKISGNIEMNIINTSTGTEDSSVMGIRINDAYANINTATINVKGYGNNAYARAINVQDNGVLDINGVTNLDVYSASTTLETGGIFLGSGATVNINASSNMKIEAPNNTVMGIGPTNAGTIVNISNGAVINAEVIGGANNRTMGMGLGSGGCIVNQDAGTTVDLKVKGDSSLVYGIYVSAAAEYNGYGDVNIVAEGNNAPKGIYVAGTGKGIFDGNTFIKSKYALGVGGSTAASLIVNSTGTKKVQLEGTIRNAGTGANVIDVTFNTPDSYLTGESILESAGSTKFALGSTARWNMTADSMTTDIAFYNGGIVDMNYTGAGNYEKYITNTFSGNNGEIIMTTDLQSSHDNKKVQDGNVNVLSDRIEIRGQSSGTHVINIFDASLLNNVEAEGYLLLIEDRYNAGKDYNNLATFVGGNLRKGGIWKYTPVITDIDPVSTAVDPVDGYDGVTTDVCPPGCGGSLLTDPPCTTPGHLWTNKSWYLTASEKTNEVLPSVQPNINSSAVRYLNYWRELDTLNQRLGEMRRNDEEDGVWVRFKKGNEQISKLGLDSNKYTMFQVGYDKKFESKSGESKTYLGAAFHETKGDQVYDESTVGKTTNRAVTLYGTWYGNKGHYLDLVGKLGRMQKEFTYYGDGYLYLDEAADSANKFYNISVEYGRKIEKDGWYYEPQAQLTYGHISANDYISDQEIYVYNDAVRSLVGRTGLMLGKVVNHKGSTGDIYAKAFYNKEFKGKTNVSLEDVYGDTYSERNDYGGGWWTVGLGTNWQMGPKNNFYLDLEKTFGGYVTTKWQINTGLRFSF